MCTGVLATWYTINGTVTVYRKEVLYLYFIGNWDRIPRSWPGTLRKFLCVAEAAVYQTSGNYLDSREGLQPGTVYSSY